MGKNILEQSITDGIVSARERQVSGKSYIQHTAAINPGNSGGPLVNETGEITGVNTLKADMEGVGFAIPIERIRKIINER